MGFFDWIKQQTATLTTEVQKFRNQDFMRAVVAGCALVAYADGDVSAEEKRKMVRFIEQNDALKVFDTGEVIKVFNSFIDKFDFDLQIGRAEALKQIGRIKSNTEAARLMVRVCCAIGAADGNFDDKEKAVVRDMCRELGLEPTDFNL